MVHQRNMLENVSLVCHWLYLIDSAHLKKIMYTYFRMHTNVLTCSCPLRCFFIAQSYVLVKKWSEALVLYERVLKYAKEVRSKAKSLNNSLKVSHIKNAHSRYQQKSVTK